MLADSPAALRVHVSLTLIRYRHDHYRSRVQELNASDERGIAVIREKVKTFAQAAASEIPTKCAPVCLSVLLRSADDLNRGGHTIPPYKLIILDEADSLTQDAQVRSRSPSRYSSSLARGCDVKSIASV